MQEATTPTTRIPNFRPIPGTRLHRCGSPELGSEEDFAELLQKIGIRTIVDVRTGFEQKLIDEEKLSCLHRFFRPRNDSRSASHADSTDSTEAGNLDEETQSKADDTIVTGQVPGCHLRLTATVAGDQYTQLLLSRLPWYARSLLPFLLLVRTITGTGHLVMLRLIVRYSVNPFGIVQQYKDMVDTCSDGIIAVLRVLSERRHSPSLLCCTAGKDRTGVITALVLSLLGFSRDDIAEDYAKSEEGSQVFQERVQNWMESVGLSREFAGAKKETILQLLDHVENRYGSVSSYLNSHGFDSSDQDTLRQNLMATEDT